MVLSGIKLLGGGGGMTFTSVHSTYIYMYKRMYRVSYQEGAIVKYSDAIGGGGGRYSMYICIQNHSGPY